MVVRCGAWPGAPPRGACPRVESEDLRPRRRASAMCSALTRHRRPGGNASSVHGWRIAVRVSGDGLTRTSALAHARAVVSPEWSSTTSHTLPVVVDPGAHAHHRVALNVTVGRGVGSLQAHPVPIVPSVALFMCAGCLGILRGSELATSRMLGFAAFGRPRPGDVQGPDAGRRAGHPRPRSYGRTHRPARPALPMTDRPSAGGTAPRLP